jgi:hypothetical protein
LLHFTLLYHFLYSFSMWCMFIWLIWTIVYFAHLAYHADYVIFIKESFKCFYRSIMMFDNHLRPHQEFLKFSTVFTASLFYCDIFLRFLVLWFRILHWRNSCGNNLTFINNYHISTTGCSVFQPMRNYLSNKFLYYVIKYVLRKYNNTQGTWKYCEISIFKQQILRPFR